MNGKLIFHTSCVDQNNVGPYGESIHEMMDSIHLNEISNARFITRYAKESGIVEDVLQIANHTKSKGFKEDFAVSCYSSFFQGIPCLVVRSSAIEYIYIEPKHASRTVNGAGINKRNQVAEDLQLRLDESHSWSKAKYAIQKKEALIEFIKEHTNVIAEHNLLAENIVPELDAIPTKELKKIDQQFILPARAMEPIK